MQLLFNFRMNRHYKIFRSPVGNTMTRLRSLLVVVVVVVGSSSLVMAGEAEDKRAECLMWAHLENKTLPLQVHR